MSKHILVNVVPIVAGTLPRKLSVPINTIVDIDTTGATTVLTYTRSFGVDPVVSVQIVESAATLAGRINSIIG